MAQTVFVLANTHLLVEGATDLGPSHTCEGGFCTYVSECSWLRRWREQRAAGQSALADEEGIL